MGNRLSKIYTRTGDDGTTGMGDGSRVEKDDPRIEAIGAVDELNSTTGFLLTHELPDAVRASLTGIQHRLFDIGGEFSIPGTTIITAEQVEQLEQTLDELNAVAVAPPAHATWPVQYAVVPSDAVTAWANRQASIWPHLDT